MYPPALAYCRSLKHQPPKRTRHFLPKTAWRAWHVKLVSFVGLFSRSFCVGLCASHVGLYDWSLFMFVESVLSCSSFFIPFRSLFMLCWSVL